MPKEDSCKGGENGFCVQGTIKSIKKKYAKMEGLCETLDTGSTSFLAKATKV